jgi:uncharacterized protein involved in copper resistance
MDHPEQAEEPATEHDHSQMDHAEHAEEPATEHDHSEMDHGAKEQAQ